MTHNPRLEWEQLLGAIGDAGAEAPDVTSDDNPLSAADVFDVFLEEASDEAILLYLESLPSVSRTEREQAQFVDRLRVAAALRQTLPTPDAGFAPGGRVFQALREGAGLALDAWARLLAEPPDQWERVEAGRRQWMLLQPVTVERVANLAGWPLRTLMRLLEEARDVELAAWRQRFRTPQVSPLYRSAVVRESTPPPERSIDSVPDPMVGIEKQYADFFASMRSEA